MDEDSAIHFISIHVATISNVKNKKALFLKNFGFSNHLLDHSLEFHFWSLWKHSFEGFPVNTFANQQQAILSILLNTQTSVTFAIVLEVHQYLLYCGQVQSFSLQVACESECQFSWVIHGCLMTQILAMTNNAPNSAWWDNCLTSWWPYWKWDILGLCETAAHSQLKLDNDSFHPVQKSCFGSTVCLQIECCSNWTNANELVALLIQSSNFFKTDFTCFQHCQLELALFLVVLPLPTLFPMPSIFHLTLCTWKFGKTMHCLEILQCDSQSSMHLWQWDRMGKIWVLDSENLNWCCTFQNLQQNLNDILQICLDCYTICSTTGTT